ncbi:glycoside hydrolase family 97 catalytic domain-containing protein [Haloferula sargassicola]|uniref:Fibronectin type-III domain-containing protein n=1 Tax=Haloferula sargassicola TaxID=490096 RepID=A0ABP9UIH4_9BACT
MRFLSALLVLVSLSPLSFSQTITSPNGRIAAGIATSGGRLVWSLSLDGETVMDASPLGFEMNGSDRGDSVSVAGVTTGEGDTSFPSRHGVHGMAVDHFRSGRWEITHGPTGERYFLNLRAYDGGIAFRYELEYEGAKNITAEKTGYAVPQGSRIFAQGNVDIYENSYGGADIDAIANGTQMGPPVVGRLASGVHFAITHSGPGEGFPSPYLRKAAGRLLETVYVRNGDNTFGASTGANAYSPWNVVTAGSLDDLVNSDLVEVLAPAPDPALYPDGGAWARPGRSVWDWMSRFPGGITPENSKLESLWASRLGFEYNTIDEGWGNWNGGDPWDDLQEVVEASEAVGVKVLVWVRSRDIRSRAQRDAFFGRIRSLGVSGFKADFFDFSGLSPASKERVRLAERILKDAARYQLVVDLHGIGKPMGQFRTFPNLLSIEGIHGKEQFPGAGSTVFQPLTRLLAGPADFTPLGLQGRLQGDQTQAFEIATVATMAGPLITFAERADRIAQSPFAPVITGIPCLWDETRVLGGTTVGETCAMARRKGSTWYVAVMNSGMSRTWSFDLGFLDAGRDYQAEIVRDGSTELERRVVTREGFLAAETQAGGGFVARLTVPAGEPVRELPFETSFSPGRGAFFAEQGVVLSTEPWAEPLLADRLPDLMWAMTGDGGLTPSLEESDAWNGGSSLLVEGTLHGTTDLALFATDLVPGSDTRLTIAFKSAQGGASRASIGLNFESGPPAWLPFPDAAAGAWMRPVFDLSPYAGRRLTAVSLRFESGAEVAGYSLRLGSLAIGDEPVAIPFAPGGFVLENVGTTGLDSIEGELRWEASPGAVSYYTIYQVSEASGTRRWLGVTAGTSFPVAASRLDDEAEMVFQIAATGPQGTSSGLREMRIALPARPSLGPALSGTVIGTEGSYQDSGATREKVFDGDTATFFDAPQENGAWAGLDLGEPRTIRAVRFYPREGWAIRMVGGLFQGSDSAGFGSPVTLASVSAEPGDGQFKVLTFETPQTFRYVRYLSPAGGWGNVAEVEFLPPGAPSAPTGVEAQRSGATALVEWFPSASVDRYRVRRATVSGGPYVEVGESTSGGYFYDDGLVAGVDFFYVVTGISPDGDEGPPSGEAAARDDFALWAEQTGNASADFEGDGNGNGLPDGIDYALSGAPEIETAPEGNRLRVELRDDRLLDVRLFRSSDLSLWEEVPAGPLVPEPGGSDGFQRFVFEDSAPPVDGPVFYRFRLSR